MDFMAWIPFASGVWLIILALWMSTKNFRSMLIFKALPLFLGAGNCIVGLKTMGVI